MRLAILDHSTHTLFVEDVNDDILEGQYGGNEELYIEENYAFRDDDMYSWDYIIDTEYFPEEDKTPIEVEFTDLLKE